MASSSKTNVGALGEGKGFSSAEDMSKLKVNVDDDAKVGSGAARAAFAARKLDAGVSEDGLTRSAEPAARQVGRGPIPYDKRKFRYDKNEAKRLGKVRFAVSRADRMDAQQAGEVLNRIHEMLGIDKENENLLAAFDKALFFEHAVNGASMLQPGRGVISVGDDTVFELAPIKTLLGQDLRRFFRAFADETVDVLQEVLSEYDAWDPDKSEKCGIVRALAAERNLIKYPYLIHDSADACLNISLEEREAVLLSKKSVLENNRNKVDVLRPVVDEKILSN